MKPTLTLLATLLLAAPLASHADAIAGKRPKVVFFLTDDQGYGDISARPAPSAARVRPPVLEFLKNLEN